MGLAEELQEETAEVLATSDPLPHGQSAGRRAGLPGVARGLPGGRGADVRRCTPPTTRGRTSSRGWQGGDGPALGLPLARRHGARRRPGLAADPWGARAARRLPLGPRRDRHEEPDRRRGRRAGDAGAQRRQAERDDQAVQRRRRGDRRRAGRPVAHRAAPRRARACDYLLNEGGGAVMPYGDRRAVRRLRRGEGHVPLPRARRPGRAAHASVPGPGARTRCSSSRRRSPRSAPRKPGFDLTEATHALLEGLGEDPANPQQALDNVTGIEPRLGPLLDAALRVTFAPTIVSRRREDQRRSPRAPSCASTAASRRGWAPTSRASACARCSTATSRSSSPRRSRATARRSARR